jgi:hypothetical protein
MMVEEKQRYNSARKEWEKIPTTDTKDGVEFKTLLTGKGFSAIDHAVRDAGHKLNLRLLVLDNRESLFISDEDAVKHTKASLQKRQRRVPEVLLLKKDGTIQTIRAQK